MGGGSFGLTWDPSSWAVRLAIATGIVSVLVMGAHHLPLGEAILNAFIFRPGDVLHQHSVWQLVTYAFVQSQPIGLLFAVYALWAFGIDVERRLGSRAFFGYFFGLAFVGSLVTTLLALIFPRLQAMQYEGAYAVGTGLVVVWARLNRGAMINFFFFPMSAELLVWLTLGLLVLYSIAGSPLLFIPDFAAFAAADLSMRSGFDLSPRRLYLRFRARQIERDLRKKASRFTVISGGGDEDDKQPGGPGRGPNGDYLN